VLILVRVRGIIVWAGWGSRTISWICFFRGGTVLFITNGTAIGSSLAMTITIALFLLAFTSISFVIPPSRRPIVLVSRITY
jgi:hypothetical protein